MFSAWHVIPSAVILAALAAALLARPPRGDVHRIELTRLLAVTAALYLVGLAALLAHRGALAGVVVGAGLAASALALWLWRGGLAPPDDDDRRDGGSPLDPGPEPEGPGGFDWNYYADQLRDPAPR